VDLKITDGGDPNDGGADGAATKIELLRSRSNQNNRSHGNEPGSGTLETHDSIHNAFGNIETTFELRPPVSEYTSDTLLEAK
jgi:hypothetical protein